MDEKALSVLSPHLNGLLYRTITVANKLEQAIGNESLKTKDLRDTCLSVARDLVLAEHSAVLAGKVILWPKEYDPK